jgi:hypothetical protein
MFENKRDGITDDWRKLRNDVMRSSTVLNLG